MNRVGRILLYYVLPVVIVGGLIAGATVWFLRTYHRVEREVPMPIIGEAKYNPLYALRKALQADGIDAESHAKLNIDIGALQPGDTLLLYAEPHMLTPEQSRRLLEWVERGGHLLLQLPSSELDLADPPHILGELQVRVEKQPSGRYLRGSCQGWVSSPSESSGYRFCGGPRFNLHEPAALQWEDDDGDLLFARIEHGRGRVDVWSQLRFLGNDYLRNPYNGDLARQALAPNYRQGRIYLIHATQMPSLWRTLLQKGWPIWLPLALGLLAWLWRRMQRFGPWLPPPFPERRSLLEHVDASGEFLFRHADAGLLYAASRDSFMAWLRWRDPIAVALTGEAQEEAIAQRLGQSRAYVHDALQTPGANDRHAYVERVRRLIHMRNLL